jgi:hypothetical protein
MLMASDGRMRMGRSRNGCWCEVRLSSKGVDTPHAPNAGCMYGLLDARSAMTSREC